MIDTVKSRGWMVPLLKLLEEHQTQQGSRHSSLRGKERGREFYSWGIWPDASMSGAASCSPELLHLWISFLIPPQNTSWHFHLDLQDPMWMGFQQNLIWSFLLPLHYMLCLPLYLCEDIQGGWSSHLCTVDLCTWWFHEIALGLFILHSEIHPREK